jgi:hypothetical protein
VVNRCRDAFPAACCVLSVCCLAVPILRSLLRGFFIWRAEALKLALIRAANWFGAIIETHVSRANATGTCMRRYMPPPVYGTVRISRILNQNLRFEI